MSSVSESEFNGRHYPGKVSGSHEIVPWKSGGNSLNDKIEKHLRKTKHQAEYLHEVVGGRIGLPSRFDAHALTDDHEIEKARKMATETFVRLGKIGVQAVDMDTYLPKSDPMLDKSTFLGLYKKNEDELLGTVRFVHDDVANTRMPVEQLPKESQELLAKLESGTYAEVGAAAKRRGVAAAGMLRLMATMVHTAQQQGVEYIGFGLEPKAAPLYEKVFGGIMEPLNNGELVYFPGINGGQAPYLLNIGKTMEDSVERQQDVKNATLLHKMTLKAIGAYLHSTVR